MALLQLPKAATSSPPHHQRQQHRQSTKHHHQQHSEHQPYRWHRRRREPCHQRQNRGWSVKSSWRTASRKTWSLTFQTSTRSCKSTSPTAPTSTASQHSLLRRPQPKPSRLGVCAFATKPRHALPWQGTPRATSCPDRSSRPRLQYLRPSPPTWRPG